MIRGGPFGGGLASAAPLLEHPRYEVFPAGGVADAVAQWVRPGMTVTVTASPTKGLDATLDLTEKLAGSATRWSRTCPPGWCATTRTWPTSPPG